MAGEGRPVAPLPPRGGRDRLPPGPRWVLAPSGRAAGRPVRPSRPLLPRARDGRPPPGPAPRAQVLVVRGRQVAPVEGAPADGTTNRALGVRPLPAARLEPGHARLPGSSPRRGHRTPPPGQGLGAPGLPGGTPGRPGRGQPRSSSGSGGVADAQAPVGLHTWAHRRQRACRWRERTTRTRGERQRGHRTMGPPFCPGGGGPFSWAELYHRQVRRANRPVKSRTMSAKELRCPS